MIYLIDFENVHEEGFSALGRLGEKDAVYCFFTRNVAKISMSALAGMRSGQLHFIEAESGKQSLDLALVSFLGYLIGTRPQELYYDIVSNDNGFAKVAEFWNRRGNGLRVRIRKTTDLKPKAEPVKPQPTVNPQRRALPQKTAAEQPVPAPETAEPAPAPAAAEETAAKTEQAPVAAAAAEPKQESGRAAQNRTRGRQRSQRQRGARQEQQANASASVPAAAPAPEGGNGTGGSEAAPVVEAVPVQVTPVPADTVKRPQESKPIKKQAEKTRRSEIAQTGRGKTFRTGKAESGSQTAGCGHCRRAGDCRHQRRGSGVHPGPGGEVSFRQEHEAAGLPRRGEKIRPEDRNPDLQQREETASEIRKRGL